jgi:hypothetical protein
MELPSPQVISRMPKGAPLACSLTSVGGNWFHSRRRTVPYTKCTILFSFELTMISINPRLNCGRVKYQTDLNSVNPENQALVCFPIASCVLRDSSSADKDPVSQSYMVDQFARHLLTGTGLIPLLYARSWQRQLSSNRMKRWTAPSIVLDKVIRP